ncbi:uncharacterized protein LOC116109754 [Pistacia vera]|uniref:uncharacterized protein LOC116109754 n=1 Tax=Pistacia vera TaxID=55513 RepID=UPI00126358C1|nr:uncharacterized protein LOC116109754 [Pistacia vera]
MGEEVADISAIVERISALPEPILHHILSFLSFKQVSQTSIVSTTWEKSWHTFLVLEFELTSMCGENTYEPAHNENKKWIYSLPQMVLCAESVDVLNFAADEVIENILAGCPLIKDLCFQYC